jgi:predicted phosphodiesterase
MKVFIISDTHFPFVDQKAYKKMMQALKKEKPDVVIQIGDVLDQYVFSKYTRSLEIIPSQEISKGLKMAESMWAEIRKIVPKAKCYQILGNHDLRLAKRISEKMPELSTFVKIQDFYKFDGVEVLDSDREYLELDGVVYVHGWLSKSIDHAKYFGKPVVHGHSHKPSITFDSPNLWTMDVGFLADRNAPPLQYTASKFSKWTLACGVVEDGKPRLLILE